MLRPFFPRACLGIFLFLSALARADDEALRQLSARLDGVKSLQGQFVQTVTDEQGKVLQTSQGSIAVKRGNKLRWETTAPFAYLIVTDGAQLWRYDRDLEQATRQKFTGELANTPALILSGDMPRIRANYDVSLERGSAGDYFKLVPKHKGALFNSLTLLFNGKSVGRLTLLDNLDQKTEIQFSGVVENPALNDSQFQFAPPAGVDVVADET